jgi:hypothetical protein
MTRHEKDEPQIQLAAELLVALSRIAKTQGKTLQEVIDDALQDYLNRLPEEHPRSDVTSAFANSLDEFARLYQGLADAGL